MGGVDDLPGRSGFRFEFTGGENAEPGDLPMAGG